MFVLDASNCQVEYNIAENPSGIHLTDYTWKSPLSGEVMFAAGHQHNGAYNITLYRKKTVTSPVEVICTSVPTYGTGTEPGNEKGYLTAMSTCDFGDKPFKIAKGDIIGVHRYKPTSCLAVFRS